MTKHGAATPDQNTVFQGGRSGNCPVSCDHTAPAHADIVGNLALVIDYRARSDHRVWSGAPIDGRVCANLDMITNDHAPELGNALVVQLR